MMIRKTVIKRREETFWGDEYIHYLEFGDGFVGVYACQNLRNHILEICAFYFMSIISALRCKKEKKKRLHVYLFSIYLMYTCLGHLLAPKDSKPYSPT